MRKVCLPVLPSDGRERREAVCAERATTPPSTGRSNEERSQSKARSLPLSLTSVFEESANRKVEPFGGK